MHAQVLHRLSHLISSWTGHFAWVDFEVFAWSGKGSSDTALPPAGTLFKRTNKSRPYYKQSPLEVCRKEVHNSWQCPSGSLVWSICDNGCYQHSLGFYSQKLYVLSEKNRIWLCSMLMRVRTMQSLPIKILDSIVETKKRRDQRVLKWKSKEVKQNGLKEERSRAGDRAPAVKWMTRVPAPRTIREQENWLPHLVLWPPHEGNHVPTQWIS